MKAPKTSQELFERALGLHREGRAADAEPYYRKVISRNAQHERALFGLSVVLLETGRLDEATRYLERAVAVAPHHPKYLTNLGEAYRRQGRLAHARAAFERVLQGDPDFAEARQNLAITLILAGENAEALAHLERVVALRPDHPLAHVTLAWVLSRLQRPEASLAHARRALELAPDLAPAHFRLGNALEELGDKPGAIAAYRRALELNPADRDAHSSLIVVMLTDPAYDSRALGAEARAWAKLHAEPLRPHVVPLANSREPERRLRVGYVSPDFRAHAVQQFLVPLFRAHDPSAFEIFLYSSVARPDAETEWYRTFAGARFRDIVAMDDVAAAELVRRDGIDVLVDLAVHSAGHRLRVFACKPAPVQITWLGYCGTTGLDTIDFRITDPHFDPPGTDLGVYSEESLRLPESFWCYDALASELDPGPVPALARGHVTFGCLNAYRKLHPGALALWARVLREVPGSRLALLVDEYQSRGVRQTLAAQGIPPERLELEGRVSRRQYLERYQRIDVALDTFPFAGGTTSLDALWMGVPVLTLNGEPTLQRAGVTIAMNLELPELIARDEEEFVARSVALARNFERLTELRATLRARLVASPLGDAPRFARHLEAAYRTAWRRYCASG